jgi:predicted MFS family arabinose efflux permease
MARRARRRRLPRNLTPLRHRGFRLLASGQFASNVGDSFYMVALPWYVLASHGGAILLGTVLVAYGIPRTVLLAVGGHASDRWRPWTVMMVTDTARVLGAAALAVAAGLGPARAAVLLPIAVVLGAGEGLFLPGSFSIVPALLRGEDLQAGNALLSGGTQLATLAGPALAGTVVALIGPAPAFWVDAASFAVSALTLAGVRTVQRPSRSPVAAVTAAAPTVAQSGPAAGSAEPGGQALTVRGLLRSQRVLQIALLVTVAANLGSAGDTVALPSLVRGVFHGGASGYGTLIAAFGAGALLGTLVAGHAGQLRRPAVVGGLAFLAEAVFMAVIPYAGGVLGAGAALVVYGAMNGFGNVVMITAFQRWAPPALLGRLTGVLMLASFGVLPVSAAFAAFVVHGLGPAPFFPLAAAILAASILTGLSQRSWREFGRAGSAGPWSAGLDEGGQEGGAALERAGGGHGVSAGVGHGDARG